MAVEADMTADRTARHHARFDHFTLGIVVAVVTITCDCGSKVPIPDNPSAAQSVTTPCLKCKTQWVFHYDPDGRYLNFCQNGGY